MTKQSIDTIQTLLTETRDSVKATHCHLQHQLQLPERWRINELSQEELESAENAMRLRLHFLETTIADFELEYEINFP